MNGSGAILFLPFYKSKLFEHEFLQSLLSALDFSLCILEEEFLENRMLFPLGKVHHYMTYYLNVQNLFLEGFILLELCFCEEKGNKKDMSLIPGNIY